MAPISPAAAGSETMRAFVLQGLGGALENIRLQVSSAALCTRGGQVDPQRRSPMCNPQRGRAAGALAPARHGISSLMAVDFG